MSLFPIDDKRLLESVIQWLSRNWMGLSFLILSIILPIIWFSSNFLYAPEEILFSNYQIIFDKFLYAWGDKLNYGTPASPEIASLIFPNAIFYKLFSSLGFSNHAVQIFYLQSFVFLSLLSISHFLKIFTDSKRLIAVGSFVYFFNFYTFQSFAYSAKMSQMILAPLFFYLMYKYLSTREYRYVALNFIGLFLFQNIFTNLPQALATFSVYVIAIMYFIYVHNYKIKLFLAIYIKKIVVFFTILLPIPFYHALVYYFSIVENMTNIGKYFGFSAITAPLHLIFQLRGSWWEYGVADNVPYSHWLYFYDNWLIIFSTLFIFLLMLVPSFGKKEFNKKYLFWVAIFLVAVFFTSGSIFAPNLFLLFYNYVPFFYIFREPWVKFMPFVLLSLSVLLAISLKRINKKMFFFILLLLLIRSLNFFSPNFFDHSNANWKKIFIKPPLYWDEYFNWSKNNTDKYVLNMPFFDNTGGGFQYKWYPQDLGNSNVSINFIFDQSNAVREKPGYSRISKFNAIAESFDKAGSVDFIKIGTVDYMLKQDDFAVSGKTQDEVARSVKKYFEEKPNVSFGDKLNLYKIKPEFFIPRIYIPTSVIISSQPIERIARIVSSESFSSGDIVFIREQNLERAEQLEKLNDFQKNKAVSVNFKKINPTKYRVHISNAKGDFPLVFLENYNQHWKTYAVDSRDSIKGDVVNEKFWETWFKDPINNDDNHLMANGYANSWVINTDEICSNDKFCTQNSDDSYNLEFLIEYQPQRLFYIGIIFSGLVLLACLGYLSYDFKKNMPGKHKH
ncbi:MAG: hypothetical protein WC238_02400 [Parcubacteria group bacterium]|jgi:hypothetical protein